MADNNSSDPIFAAIERHQAADTRYGKTAMVTDPIAAKDEIPPRTIVQSDLDAFNEADTLESVAVDELLATVPTSVQGVAALLAYVGNRHLGFDREQLSTMAETVLRSLVFATA